MTPDTPDQRVLRQFRMVFAAVRSHFKHIEQSVGLGGAQAWALSLIAEQPGIDTSTLTKILNIRQSTVSQALKGLQKRGLIQVDTHDSVLRLSLTTTGRALACRIPAPSAGVLPIALKALPAEAIGQLEHNLATLIQLLSADPLAADIPLSEI